MGRRPLPKRLTPLLPRPLTPGRSCGISTAFAVLSHTSGQVAYVLRTRSPLGTPSYCYVDALVRLACIKHAASVHPEPGSNSPLESHPLARDRFLIDWTKVRQASRHSSVVKVLSLKRTDATIRCVPRQGKETRLPMPSNEHRRGWQTAPASCPGSLTPTASSTVQVCPCGRDRCFGYLHIIGCPPGLSRVSAKPTRSATPIFRPPRRLVVQTSRPPGPPDPLPRLSHLPSTDATARRRAL